MTYEITISKGWEIALEVKGMKRFIVDLEKTRTFEIEAADEASLYEIIEQGGYPNDGWRIAEITEVPN